MMLCFRSFLHSNEIGTHLSMLTLGVSPPLRVKFGSRRGAATVGARMVRSGGEGLYGRPFASLVIKSFIAQPPPRPLTGMSKIQDDLQWSGCPFCRLRAELSGGEYKIAANAT